MKDKTLVESVKAILKLPMCHFTEKGITKINEPFKAVMANFLGDMHQYGVCLFKHHVNITIWFHAPDSSVSRRSPLMQIPLTENESEELHKLFNDALARFKQECVTALKLPMLTSLPTTIDSLSEDENCK